MTLELKSVKNILHFKKGGSISRNEGQYDAEFTHQPKKMFIPTKNLRSMQRVNPPKRGAVEAVSYCLGKWFWSECFRYCRNKWTIKPSPFLTRIIPFAFESDL